MACLLALAAMAQNSGIRDVVTDPTGAPVPQVAITITNLATGVATAVKTNEQGFYTAPFLPPGPYRIEANPAGFARVSRENLILNVGQVARVDFELELGAIAESIEVTTARLTFDIGTLLSFANLDFFTAWDFYKRGSGVGCLASGN